ncbi:MAG: YggS family pyridoxal phosphate-dependent enzyme [Desulfobacteraceae bacterium]|nr:YggS family pyridoxal phosphate-dependent enzyme [Desulfobacteraceae bacterium]
MSGVRENLTEIRRRLAQAAARAGRRAEEVALVAVSKRVDEERLREAAAAGQTVFGENYLQEAEGKIEALAGAGLCWHFIGKLQSNKLGRIAALFSVVETLDQARLAGALEDKLVKIGKIMTVYIQVNVGREPQKAGVLPEDLDALARAVTSCPHLRLAGLMMLPPQHPDPEASRPYFRQTRALVDSLFSRGLAPQPLGLSMGMSNDYQVAVEEGATLVRVGSALFGPRS